MEAQGREDIIILLGDNRSGWRKFVELLRQNSTNFKEPWNRHQRYIVEKKPVTKKRSVNGTFTDEKWKTSLWSFA